MKKRLFDGNNERYNEEGLLLFTKAANLIRPLFEEYVEMGYSVRDIEYILEKEVNSLSLCIFLELSRNIHK